MDVGGVPGGPEDAGGAQEPQPGSGPGPSWPPPPGGPTGYGSPGGPAGYGGPPGTPQPGPGGPAPGGPAYGGPGQWPQGYGTPLGTRPPTYLAWGIAAAIGGVLFCLIGGVPTAIASTIYARRVQQKWAAGDQQGALQDSRTARTWAIIATVLDVLGILLVVYLFTQGSVTTGSP